MGISSGPFKGAVARRPLWMVLTSGAASHNGASTQLNHPTCSDKGNPASNTRRSQTNRDQNSDPSRIPPMQVTKSSLGPGRTKRSHSTILIIPHKGQERTSDKSLTSAIAGRSSSPPPLARNIPVSPALEKFRYLGRPLAEPTSDAEEDVPQVSSPPSSPHKRTKVHPIGENTDPTKRKTRTRTESALTPTPPPPPPTLVLPEYDEFGEIVIPESQSSQHNTLQEQDSSLQDGELIDQDFEADLPSSIELPSQLARHIQLDQSSPRSRSRPRSADDTESQPPELSDANLYDGQQSSHGEREQKEDLSKLLLELEASGNLEAHLAFSDDEKDELEAAVRVDSVAGDRRPVFAPEKTHEPLQHLPLLIRPASPKPAPNLLVSEAVAVASEADHRNEGRMSSRPLPSSPHEVDTDDLDPLSSQSRTLRALSSDAIKETDQRRSVELCTPPTARIESPVPRLRLAPTQRQNGSTPLDYLMAKHTPIPQRPTHRLVPLTPEGLSTHLTRMLDSYRCETAATKALVESQQSFIDEQGEEIVRLRGDAARLQVTERRYEKLTTRVEVLEEIRKGLLGMLEDKENECQALRNELTLYKGKLGPEKDEDIG
ncbi:BQ2448_4968 [Microbotryum intermedium]|uniref:BQ2448_4968 protein n=1 Tax=Microbotryum intermedium TaxID=269621 RepID=A0A238FK59_9BASI|nr:BQ2448_4968 [Microbotryum intermedium]